jgi:hypothetical protein
LHFFKQGETSLVRLEFFCSGRGVGENVEREDNVSLAAKFAQLDAIALMVGQFKIRGRVTNLERGHALFRKGLLIDIGPQPPDEQFTFVSNKDCARRQTPSAVRLMLRGFRLPVLKQAARLAGS